MKRAKIQFLPFIIMNIVYSRQTRKKEVTSRHETNFKVFPTNKPRKRPYNAIKIMLNYYQLTSSLFNKQPYKQDPVPNSLYDLCGRKATLEKEKLARFKPTVS